MEHVNLEHGRAWPSDARIAQALGKDRRTVSRGWEWLDRHGLIDRETRTKWGPDGQVVGSERRFYLAIPEGTNLTGGTLSSTDRRDSRKTPEILEGTPTGHAPIDGTKSPVSLDGTDAVPRLMTYPTYDVRDFRRVPARSIPKPFTGDTRFMDAFDREVVRLTSGSSMGADDVKQIVRHAFDAATNSDDAFMPFEWSSVVRLNDNGLARDWFVDRAVQLAGANAA